MPFSITAELPLGTFRGHGADGRIEAIPSVARLYSALLCAAGFGPRARSLDDDLSPCEADAAALRWLEDHPPDGVCIPPLRVNRGVAVAYRDDGTLRASKGLYSTKKLAKSPDMSVAVGGRFSWTWNDVPPKHVLEALTELCPEVSHLGTSESPVQLAATLDDVEPTHALDVDAGMFSMGGHDVELPGEGRLDELTAAYRVQNAKVPSAARDRYGTDEKSSSPVPPRGRVALARYSPREALPADVPWPQVLLLPLDRPVPESVKVRWAVAAHRALIAAIGDGAPPLVTGIYPSDQRRPANRLALHLLDSRQPVDLPDGAPAALAVLVPQDADAGDVQTALTAIANLRSIRGPRGELRRVVGGARGVSGSEFWRDRATDCVRLWQTSPPAVPDTRGSAPDWTFHHAALLSLGFVWHGTRALPAQPGRGEALHRNVLAAADNAGAVVIAADPLRTSSVHEYVHRVNEHAVVRPYRATLSVGVLGGEQVIQAIGQSRHLGGGLLVPVDVPVGSAPEQPPSADVTVRRTS